MPTYTFLNSLTNEVEEHVMKMAEYDDFLQINSHLTRHFAAVEGSIGDSVRLGITRNDDGFREVLSKISEANYKSNLGSKLSRR